MNVGIWSLLPPVIIIVVAIITRNTVVSLLTGVITCCIIQAKTGFIGAIIDLAYKVGCNEDTVWYVLFVGLFACMLGLWQKVGATYVLAQKLQKYATNERRTLVLTWIIGVLVFIDDFTSIAVNATMTKLYDKNKIPRAALTYIADCTASPICILVPFGTWAIFYQGVFSGYDEVTSLGSMMHVYTKMIPSLFYGWLALIIPLLFALKIIPPLWGMKTAYRRAEETGELYTERTKELNQDEEADKTYDKPVQRILSFLIPLAIFIVTVVITSDVIIGCIYALIAELPMILIMRLAKPSEAYSACMTGIKDMLELILIVILAYMLRDGLVEIGLADYVIGVAKPLVSPAMLPFITFLICAFLTFVSGSNWGATLAVAAVIIPLCSAVGGNMIYVLSAIVSGAAFGAHACFFCDVTVFTSAMTKIDNMEHAITQLPYAMIAMVLTCVGYLVLGFV